jgi:RNA polymerase sigma-70 factor (ECF subfamily)
MSSRGETFEEAFEALFVEAFHVARRIVGGAGEAEDIAAEATARALDKWRHVSGMRSPTGWVVRVAANLAIDNLRRRRFATTGTLERPTRPDDIDTRLVVRDMLHQLPQRQRQIVALRYLVDLPEAEVADRLGISLGSVKRHHHRAINRLRLNAEVASYVS